MITNAQPSRELLQRPEAQAIIQGKTAFKVCDIGYTSKIGHYFEQQLAYLPKHAIDIAYLGKGKNTCVFLKHYLALP
jgi:hypothetical protein